MNVNFLAENSLPIWLGGAVLFTLAVVIYFQLRSTASLVAMLVVVLLTAALLVAEYVIVTPREAVERTLYELAATIEADDLPGVLRFIAPAAAEVRSDAEALMPLVVVEKARVLGTPEITVDQSAQPMTATVSCRAFAEVTVKQSGMKVPYADRVEIHFVESGGAWLIESYTPARDWRRAAGS
jgi:hypothetical protein